MARRESGRRLSLQIWLEKLGSLEEYEARLAVLVASITLFFKGVLNVWGMYIVTNPSSGVNILGPIIVIRPPRPPKVTGAISPKAAGKEPFPGPKVIWNLELGSLPNPSSTKYSHDMKAQPRFHTWRKTVRQ